MTQRIAWLAVVGGSLLVQGLVTISGILSARLLGVEGRGEVVLVVAVSGMAAQLTLGGSLPNAVTKRLADRRLTARDGVSHLVGRWTLLAVVSAVPAGALFVVLHGSPSVHVVLLAVMVGLLAIQNMAFRLVTSALLGESAPMTRIAVATLLPQTLVTVGIAVLFVVERRAGALTVLSIMVGAFATGLVVGLALLAPRRGGAEDRLDGRDLWRLTRSTYVGSIGPIDGLLLDRTLVGALLGTTVLGLYSAASALGLLPSAMGNGLAAVLLPKVAGAQGDPQAERALVRNWLVIGAVALGAVVAGVLLVTEPVIVLAFGREFEDAVPIAYWLVAAAGLLGYRRILIAVLQGRDRGGVASIIELALTPVLVLGIVVAAELGSTVAVGQSMFAVAATSVLCLAVALRRSHRPARSSARGGRHRA
ncbi:MAG: lipopolysaccharide biosynthesis protein [Aeromicrobium erythreum]